MTKFILPLFLFLCSFVCNAQTININYDNPEPFLVDVLESDTIMIDYHLTYDNININRVNRWVVPHLFEIRYYDPSGKVCYGRISKGLLNKKTILIYSSKYNTEKWL